MKDGGLHSRRGVLMAVVLAGMLTACLGTSSGTRPVCFGRFMMDVPNQTQIVWKPAGTPDSIQVFPGTEHEFRQRLQNDLDGIAREKHDTEPSMLIGVFDSVNPESKIIAEYYSKRDTHFAKFTSYIQLGQTAFIQTIPVAGLSVQDKTLPEGRRWDKTVYKQYVEELRDVAEHLRLRSEDEIPAEPGICIENGFISSSLDFNRECVAMALRFPEHPGVILSMNACGTDKPYVDIMLNSLVVESEEMPDSVTMLRKGSRLVGQGKGEEILLRRTVSDGEPLFLYSAPGTLRDVLKPYVKIELHVDNADDAGKNKNPETPVRNLDDEETAKEIVNLWDKLLSSIRVRPTIESGEHSGMKRAGHAERWKVFEAFWIGSGLRIANRRFLLKFDDGLVLEGTSDEQGAIKFPYSEISLGHYSLELLPEDSTPQAKPAKGKK